MLALALGVAAFGILGASACARSESDSGHDVPDGSLDALLVGDTTVAPPSDEEPPPGDVCGNRAGLSPGSPWPLRGGCPTRAGWSGLGGPQTSATWWSHAAAASETSPAIEGSGGAVWVGTSDGAILSLQLGSGEVRTRLSTGAPVRSSAALDAQGNAVIVGGDGVLYGLRPTASAILDDAGVPGDDKPRPEIAFQLSIGPSASSPVIGPDGTIYVGTLDGQLVAVHADGSAKKWSAATQDASGSSPAIAQDGTIWVGSSDHKLYAFQPDGSPKVAIDLGSEVTSGASAAVGGDGTVYIGTADGKLHAIGQDGKERWPAYATAGAIRGTPAVYAGTVYVGSDDKKLHAISTKDGSKRWTYDTLGAVASPVLGPDGTVYVGGADSRVYAITSKGSLFVAFNVRGRVVGAGAIAAGPTLVITTDKGVIALGP